MDPHPRPVVPPRPPLSARARWLGTVIALLSLAALGALAWYLTHRPAAPAAGATVAGAAPGAAASGGERTGAAGSGGGGGGGGPGGGPGGGRGGGAGASTVGIATAVAANLPVYFDALGTVTPSVTVTVRPQVSGVLTQVLFTEGQLVKKGQLLATIDPRSFEIALQQAIGARMRDEAQLENAKVLLQRYQTLLQQDSIARQDVDTQLAAVRQLEATLVIDRANENTARLNLGYTRVAAPASGRIGLRVVDPGNLVSASDSAGLAVITQLAPIDVEFSVPQDRVPEIQARVVAGARLPVTAFDRTRTTQLGEGVFSTLDNLIDTQTGTVRAKARFANAAGNLFPNQFVNVRLLLQNLESAVVVPVTAVRRSNTGDFVYVLQEDRSVAVRPVERGVSTNEIVSITRGLVVGERVVTEGGDRLRDGARVQLAGERPASGAAGGRRGAAAADGGASGPRQRRQRDGNGSAPAP
nr:efflux RND transporter periplasmic adaptor subunit [Caldimonas sp.]